MDQGGMIYNTKGGRIDSCRLRNVSATGAQIELLREIALPKKFLLSLAQNGIVKRKCAIVWQFSTVVGVKFVKSDA
jgi:PilZ domain